MNLRAQTNIFNCTLTLQLHAVQKTAYIRFLNDQKSETLASYIAILSGIYNCINMLLLFFLMGGA